MNTVGGPAKQKQKSVSVFFNNTYALSQYCPDSLPTTSHITTTFLRSVGSPNWTMGVMAVVFWPSIICVPQDYRYSSQRMIEIIKL